MPSPKLIKVIKQETFQCAKKQSPEKTETNNLTKEIKPDSISSHQTNKPNMPSPKSRDSKQETFQCSTCKREFAKNAGLKRHMNFCKPPNITNNSQNVSNVVGMAEEKKVDSMPPQLGYNSPQITTERPDMPSLAQITEVNDIPPTKFGNELKVRTF